MAEEEKTEDATPKKLRESREKGDVARSQEVNTAIVLAAALGALVVSARHIFEHIGGFTVFALGDMWRFEATLPSVQELITKAVTSVALALAPLMLAVVVAGIIANVIQIGFMISMKTLEPDLNKINPINGLKNFITKKKLIDLGKGLLKIIAITYVAYLTVRADLDRLPFVSDVSPRVFMAYELDLAFRLFKNVLLLYLVIAAFDYAVTKWEYSEKQKMSKQEVKDEYKNTEGDPLIKRRIRSLQMEAARRRMMAEVPEADVVVTNPTHFAVALKYDAETMIAPELVAKGADLIAKRIIEIAEENDVVIYRDPPVARAIYASTEPGDPIQAEMFQAVAEILAHVYRLSSKSQNGQAR